VYQGHIQKFSKGKKIKSKKKFGNGIDTPCTLANKPLMGGQQ
jgi:hypothetical protein